MAVSGDTVLIGAPNEASNATGIDGNQNDNSAINSGAAYIFVRNGTNWTQQAYLKASNTDAQDQFGNFLAISGDTAIISAHYESSNATGVNGDQSNNSLLRSGAVYVFTRNHGNWNQQAYLKASNPGAEDRFGRSVALSGHTLIAAGYQEDSNASGINGDQLNNAAGNSGAAYVFVRNGASWSQQAYLKASNPGVGDFFGLSVGLSADTAVIAGYLEDSGASGINGNQNDNSVIDSGAAYVFVRRGTNWSQQAYLKASNPGSNDVFGASVAVSGNTVVVGGPGEDSSAIGINGNGNDNTFSNAGAAYIFTRLGIGPTLMVHDDIDGYLIRLAGHPGFTYQLQRAAELSGAWATVATQSAPASGIVEFRDTSSPPNQSFYRVVQP